MTTTTETRPLREKLEELRARRPKLGTPAYRVWLDEYRKMLAEHRSVGRRPHHSIGRTR